MAVVFVLVAAALVKGNKVIVGLIAGGQLALLALHIAEIVEKDPKLEDLSLRL